MTRHPFRLGRIAALAVALATCAAFPRQTAAQPAPLEVPVILPLTGFGAFIGASQAAALAAVEKRVNATGGIRGRMLHFAILDSQSNPQVDLQLMASSVLPKHPPIVIDGGPATVCRAAIPQFVHGPVLWCISPAIFPDKDGFVFATGVESRLGMDTTLRWLRDSGLHRIAIISATDIAGQEASAALDGLMNDPRFHDLTVVDNERFAPSDVSVAAQIAKIAEAKPQVVITWVTGSPLGTVLHGIKDAGLRRPIVTSNAAQSWQQTQQYASILPDRFYMYSMQWPAYARMRGGPLKVALADFFGAMSAAGIHPDGNSAMVWDTGMLTATALRTLGPDAAPDAIRRYYAGLHDYYGASGAFDFRLGNQRGLGLSDCIMVRWDAASNTWQAVSHAAGALH